MICAASGCESEARARSVYISHGVWAEVPLCDQHACGLPDWKGPMFTLGNTAETTGRVPGL